MTGTAPALLTFGHGTLDTPGLASLVRDAGISLVVDVRRYPGSRTNPAAKRPALEETLGGLGVGYRWDERLGGRRRLTAEERAHNPDTWWRVEQFRAYAGWTREPEFREGLVDLMTELSGDLRGRTAVMCSEAVWWRCHRRLVADVVLGEHQAPVGHLMHDGGVTPHSLSEGARHGPDGRLVWPGDVDD